jgi:hypothetical protein
MSIESDDPRAAPTASTSLVATARPARYGAQLASHLRRRLTTSWDGEHQTGVLEFDDGRCDLSCSDDGLPLQVRVHAGADDAAALERLAHMEDVIGRHLVRFGARDELVARWRRSDGSEGTVQARASEDAQ